MANTATTFTRFGELPPEIRTMIWKLAISDLAPRDVEISCKITQSKFQVLTLYKFSCTTPSPTLLHTNREARALTQPSYCQLFPGGRRFNSSTSRDCEELSEQGAVQFNPEIDTLCCHEDDLLHFNYWDWGDISHMKLTLGRASDYWVDLSSSLLHLRRLDLYAEESMLQSKHDDMRHLPNNFFHYYEITVTLSDRQSGRLYSFYADWTHGEVLKVEDYPDLNEEWDLSSAERIP